MKYQFLSRRAKQQQITEKQEELLLSKAVFDPNMLFTLKGHKFKVNYATVRDGVLTYLATQVKTGQPYWVTEAEILA